jgi:hypothetical protein
MIKSNIDTELPIKNIDDYINASVKTERRIADESQYGRTIGIHSSARTGKTLTMVMLIIYYLTKLPYIKGVISNVVLKNLDKIGFDGVYIPLKNIKQVKKEEYKDYIIATDEFRRLCDARMSSSFRNKFISNILADTGKFRQIHILTDQEASSVDKRVRRNADAILVPFMNFTTGMCTVKVCPSYRKYFELDAYELWNQYNEIAFEYPFREYYQYYDTEQTIEDYVISFEPKDYMDLFMGWMSKMGYDKREGLVINKPMITLWKEQEGVEITSSQMSALMQYMYLESDLEVETRGRSKSIRKDDE